ncbi:MAG: hypothetical protein V1827_05660 [Candidatus Micrarchaeota archaeon]
MAVQEQGGSSRQAAKRTNPPPMDPIMIATRAAFYDMGLRMVEPRAGAPKTRPLEGTRQLSQTDIIAAVDMEALVKRLADPKTRAAAVEETKALAKDAMPIAAAVPALLACRSDADNSVREGAANALMDWAGGRGDSAKEGADISEDLSRISLLFGDDDHNVEYTAERAFFYALTVEGSKAKAMDMLIGMIYGHEEGRRYGSLFALEYAINTKLDISDAFPAIAYALSDPSASISGLASRILYKAMADERMAKPALDAVVSRLDADEHVALGAVEFLKHAAEGDLAIPDHVWKLVDRVLENKKPSVSVVNALADLRKADESAVIRNELRDTYERVRDKAKDNELSAEEITMLANGLGLEDGYVCACCVKGLKRAAKRGQDIREAVPKLRELTISGGFEEVKHDAGWAVYYAENGGLSYRNRPGENSIVTSLRKVRELHKPEEG